MHARMHRNPGWYESPCTPTVQVLYQHCFALISNYNKPFCSALSHLDFSRVRARTESGGTAQAQCFLTWFQSPHPDSSPDMRPWKEESNCCGTLLTIPKVKVAVGNRPVRGEDNVVWPRPHNIDRSTPWRQREQNNFKTTAEFSVSVA